MTTDASRSRSRGFTPFRVVAGLLAAALLFSAGMLVGLATASGSSDASPVGTPNSVDVGFARDMRDHHAQAVEMSVLVRESSDDPEIRTLALDIMLTQQQQLGQMYGWLSAWGQPQNATGAPMQWMDMGASGGGAGGEGDMGSMGHSPPSSTRMPGMATEAQLRRLARAEGQEAERIYLQLMIPHHEAGVKMAEYALANASVSYVGELAQSIVNAQTAELEVLRSMLAARGGPLEIP